jgi:acetyltransferase-like isoleucine patch superfamily enzyme
VRALKKLLRSDHLSRFNDRTGNRILSRRVALSAVQGTLIWIQPETVVDRHARIGSFTYIGFRCSIGSAEVGRYCSVADNVTIGPGEHPLTGISTSAALMEDAYAEMNLSECRLGNDVWIGVDSIIRRGVTVGNGAIVGANSFVNQSVPPFAIVAGSPARLIRYRFTSDIIAKIEASRWWDLEQDEARARVRSLEIELGLHQQRP